MTATQEIQQKNAAYQVALTFEDGVTQFITCRDTQLIADASYMRGINIPLDCTDGVCGTCKAFCEEGTYEIGSYIEDALPDDEKARGYLLPCVTKPRSNLVLQIACTSEVAKTQAASYTGTVVELRRLSATTVAFEVEIPNRSELTFLPGQYVNIAVPGTEVTRSYSFANAPHQERLTFLVKLAPGGAMSSYLSDRAAVGDQLIFTGPHGSFFLREAETAMLLLAGGTGLAPMMAMLNKLRHDGSGRKAHLIYGVNTDEDLIELDKIVETAAALPSFSWDHCVVDPASAAPNKGPDKAYVTSLISTEHLHDGEVAIYTCGPPPMVDAVRKHFVDVNIEPVAFYYEKFALAAPAAVAEAPAPEAPAEEAPTEAAVAAPRAAAGRQTLMFAPDARSVAGQVMLSEAKIAGWSGSVRASDQGDVARRLAGQLMGAGGVGAGAALPLDEDDQIVLSTEGRNVAGQEMFPSTLSQIEPVVSPRPAVVASDGYQIGEDHPDIHYSDALFTARQALELGALDLTIGRLTSQQLAGYRLLAEATVPWLDGDRFVDAAMWTETNAAFHDYLFTLTGNEHLVQAYHALGVRGRMDQVLSNACWCHPRSAQDHLDIVAAFEAGDREAARELIIAHSGRAIETMRRAMADELAAKRPRFITAGRFADKVVLITGAAQGIGEHTARRISAEGGTLVLADRSDLVKQLADELVTTGPQTLAVTADLEDADAAHAAVQQALTRFGRIDVLVNNVGGAINFKPFTEFTNAEIRAEIDRSLMTTLYACRAVLPSMAARGQGVIVNVSSAATRGIHRIPYSAAKGGVNAITASLALEFAPAGIRVVAVAPGGTEAPPRRISRGTPEPATDTERAWLQAHVDQTLDSSLMKRYGTLDEQASAICYLASDEASYITGTVLPVAGGDQG